MEKVVYESQRKSLFKRRLVAKKAIERAKGKGCVSCGFKDKRALEFNHIRGQKEFNISVSMCKGYAVDRILREIEKCEVLCRNCHIIKTKDDWKQKWGVA